MGIIAASRLRGLGYNFFLNEFSGASLGLSVRKLNSNYSGFCIRVRRSSDDEQLDIGFLDNELDTSSLLDFVGSGNGFLTIWYDQSGNQNNATQTLPSKQPTIVNNGTLETDNGKPAFFFTDGLNGNLDFDTINQTTVLFVARIFKKSAINYILWNGNVSKGIFYNGSFPGVNGLGIFDGNIKSILGGNLNSKIGYFNYNGSNYDVAENGNNVTSLSNGNNFSLNSIGRKNITTVDLRGKVQEAILYTTEQSTNKVAMEININAYYSIY